MKKFMYGLLFLITFIAIVDVFQALRYDNRLYFLETCLNFVFIILIAIGVILLILKDLITFNFDTMWSHLNYFTLALPIFISASVRDLVTIVINLLRSPFMFLAFIVELFGGSLSVRIPLEFVGGYIFFDLELVKFVVKIDIANDGETVFYVYLNFFDEFRIQQHDVGFLEFGIYGRLLGQEVAWLPFSIMNLLVRPVLQSVGSEWIEYSLSDILDDVVEKVIS